MKKYIINAVIVTVIIPSLLICILIKLDKQETQYKEQSEETLSEQDQMTTEHKLDINVLTNSGTEIMPLEDYILGVVLGEMPAEFNQEALMAQAVVARTYACKSIRHSKHEEGDVCTDPSCCQAYMSSEEYLQSGGSLSLMNNVVQAVEYTKNEVLTYGGELIEATYFSCSGGKTEPAYAVWGADVPYLQSVDSPGEENAIHYTDTITFTAQDFCLMLETQFSGPPEGWVEDITYTAGGGVDLITLNGHTYSGTDIRRRLNLRSTAFVITAIGDTITVTTKGFGHRVGMSQYGAEAMAVRGENYEDILMHYYPGTELINFFKLQSAQ